MKKGLDSITWTLLNRGEKIDINVRDNEGRTPLHHACIKGYSEIVRQLLVKQVMVNIQSNEGYSPLHCAALSGKPEIVQMLMKSGKKLLKFY